VAIGLNFPKKLSEAAIGGNKTGRGKKKLVEHSAAVGFFLVLEIAGYQATGRKVGVSAAAPVQVVRAQPAGGAAAEAAPVAEEKQAT